MPHRLMLLLAIAPLACSSEPLPSTGDVATTDTCIPLVHVDGAAPPWSKPVQVAMPQDGALFWAYTVSSACGKAGLHYRWFYDWDGSQTVLDTTAVCQDKPTCIVVVCSRPHNTQAHHTLRMVVSDAELPPTAVSPTDFPLGTSFDTVLWELDVKGQCL